MNHSPHKFTHLIHEDILLVEALMRKQADGYHVDLQSALQILLDAGGKRIRPTITLLIGKILGAESQPLITLAAAIEMLHTATLVHDDLIDGSLLRRGMPTLNARWSTGATILTGDFIFARAADLAAHTNSLPVMQEFSQTLSLIANGEISQMLTSHCQIDRKNYFERIFAKTATLIQVAAKSAGLLSQASPEIIEIVGEYGYQIGMAFQIIDDILDFTGDQATVGKPVGNDLRQGLVTLPVILYAEVAPDDPAIRILKAGECLKTQKAVTRLVASVKKSGSIQRAFLEAKEMVEVGVKTITKLPLSPERLALEELAYFIVEREV